MLFHLFLILGVLFCSVDCGKAMEERLYYANVYQPVCNPANASYNYWDSSKCIGAGPGISGPYWYLRCQKGKVFGVSYLKWSFSNGTCYDKEKEIVFPTGTCLKNPLEGRFNKEQMVFRCRVSLL